jgi:hypothetical protein
MLIKPKSGRDLPKNPKFLSYNRGRFSVAFHESDHKKGDYVGLLTRAKNKTKYLATSLFLGIRIDEEFWDGKNGGRCRI